MCFQVQASSVISLLQSDIKSSLKAAFRNLDGPLSVTDWCKGRGQVVDTVNMGEGLSAESSVGECRDPSSTMTLSGGEPLSPCQSTVGPTSLKGWYTLKGRLKLEYGQWSLIFAITINESLEWYCNWLFYRDLSLNSYRKFCMCMFL